MESDWPTLGLVMVGGVWAGSDSPVAGWGAVPERAGNKDGVGTVRVPAPGERLKVVQGQRGSAGREDSRWALGVVEWRLWRESFAFDARVRIETKASVIVRVIFGMRAV